MNIFVWHYMYFMMINSNYFFWQLSDKIYIPSDVLFSSDILDANRKWQDYVYIQCEYKSTKRKIKQLLREENKVKANKIS